MVEIEC